ncbi:MAG: hypothetical protein K0S37_2671, partial [Microbacterium sp.]|nr:hypothetical protein [Microbacterium sp.]
MTLTSPDLSPDLDTDARVRAN